MPGSAPEAGLHWGIPTETVSVRRKSVYHLGQFPIFGTASGAGLEAIETFLVRFDS